MKNNIVFTGNESKDEDAEDKLIQFLRTELKIDQYIEYQNVHRFGKPRNDGMRPIVAKFRYNKERDMVKIGAACSATPPMISRISYPPDMN